MKTLNVLAVVAASAALSTAAFAGGTTTVSAPVTEIVLTQSNAFAASQAAGFGKNSSAAQQDIAIAEPTLVQSSATGLAAGGKSATVTGKAASTLSTVSILSVGGGY